MKITNTNTEIREQVTRMINEAEDKNAAVFDAIDMVVANREHEIEQRVLDEARQSASDAEFKKALGLRALSKNESAFYENLKNGPSAWARMAVTADQIGIIPSETVDYTLAEIKKDSGITKLISFAPANVKFWLVGEHTGAAVWGNLTDAITGELSGSLKTLAMNVFKLSAVVFIPKSIRELEIGFVDRYFTAVLEEAIRDGIAAGYLYGDGKVSPVGIGKQIGKSNEDGTAADKTKATITDFSPKGLASALKTLSHGGKRSVSKLYVIANPADVFEYVNPALYIDSLVGGYVQKAALPVEVIADSNVKTGDGFLTTEGLYTMGFNGISVADYEQTKALDDCDTLIAKVYANGRAVDDDAAVLFDVTKLSEYKLPAHKA